MFYKLKPILSQFTNTSVSKILVILLIPTIFLIYGIYTLSDYGINWDEPYHYRRGQAFLHYFLTGQKTYGNMPKYPPLRGDSDNPNFRDSKKHFKEVQENPSLSNPTFRRSYYQDDDWNGEYHIDMEYPCGHPALNGILAALFNKIFFQKLGVLGDLESYHFFQITTASFLVLVVAIFMWRQYGIVESIITSLVLSTYPLFLGEQHFNIKDPIETTFYTLTLLSAYKAITKKSPLWLLIASIAFAVGLSVKFNIVFIVFPLIIWAFTYFKKSKNNFKFNKKFILVAAIAPLIIMGLFIFFLPTLWKNPIWGIGEIINYYLKEGYALSQPPKYYYLGIINMYPLIWIFYTTPVPSLILFVLLFLFPKKLFEKNMFPILLLLSIVTTIGRITLFGALSYGGVRIIMEYIPSFAMLCGISSGLILRRIRKVLHNKSYKQIPTFIFIFLILFLYIPVIYKLITIHPNENVFFNTIAGGLSGARKKEINSWGNSNGNAYYPALLWLNENAELNAKLALPVGSISNIPRYKLRKDISLSRDYWSGPRHNGEYVIELTYDYPPMKWYSLSYLNNAMVPIYEVKVDGVSIAKVWKNSEEFVRPEFINEKIITTKITYDKESKTINLALPRAEKIMQVKLIQPTEGCEPLLTGYVDTYTDNKNWTRENEDIARDQLKHSKLKELEQEYNYYFVAREAKYIRFHPENENACILKSTNAQVVVLQN